MGVRAARSVFSSPRVLEEVGFVCHGLPWSDWVMCVVDVAFMFSVLRLPSGVSCLVRSDPFDLASELILTEQTHVGFFPLCSS